MTGFGTAIWDGVEESLSVFGDTSIYVLGNVMTASLFWKRDKPLAHWREQQRYQREDGDAEQVA